MPFPHEKLCYCEACKTEMAFKYMQRPNVCKSCYLKGKSKLQMGVPGYDSEFYDESEFGRLSAEYLKKRLV